MSTWNGNRFSLYTSEEKSVLGLIDELGKQGGSLADKLEQKTDLLGDHKGSWQGLSKPTLSEEGMRATVEKLDTDVNNITNYSINTENGLNITDKINKLLDKGGVVYLPQGEYIIDGNGIELRPNMQIIGDENNKTIIKYTGPNACFYHSANKELWGWEYSATNVVLRNINIICTNPQADGLKLDRVMRSRFDNVKIQGAKHGILVQSGWTNHFERLEIEKCDIGIKIGDNSYASTPYQSMINNATNITNSRIEYNRINIQLGDKGFDGSQQGTNINVTNNTIQFAAECEMEVISFDNINILNNYFESLNVNEECLLKVGYTLKTPNPDPFNSYLLCTNINVKGNLFCVDKGNGRIIGIKAKNHRNMIIENNTFFGFFITDHTAGKVMVLNESNDTPLDYLNNTNIGSPFNVQGNINILSKSEYKLTTFKNGWFNGGVDVSENLKVVKSDNVINIRGVIATDNFVDGEVVPIPTSIKIYDNVMSVVRSTKFSGYVDDWFKVKVGKDNKLYVTSFDASGGKVVLYLNITIVM